MFKHLPLRSNLPLLAMAAASVWWGGAGLARHADALVRKTGLDQALLGMLLYLLR
jgi:hypothetical protein